jgi:hypothetical protein
MISFRLGSKRKRVLKMVGKLEREREREREREFVTLI